MNRTRSCTVVLGIAVSMLALCGVFWCQRARTRAVGNQTVAAIPDQEDDAAILREAALQRFRNAAVSVVVGAKEIPADDEGTKEQIKVNLFKHELVKNEQKRDPQFRDRAENELRLRQPVFARVLWDDLTGNQELNFVISDTRKCWGLVGRVQKMSASELSKVACIDMPVVQNRWDDDAKLELRLEPVDEEDPKWPVLIRDTMAEMAASQFVAARNPQ